MKNYDVPSFAQLAGGNPYVGRGIVTGTSSDGKYGVCAYFIMGRSENSRNRVFAKKGDDLYTEPFDLSKVKDPALIIYRALTSVGNTLIVTNGDQTDTVAEGLRAGKSFSESLASRAFEPDAPNFTPRISAVMRFGQPFTYEMSILKSIDEKGSDTARFTFSYPSVPGLGHFLHTYVTDGDPIPTFLGEPERVAVGPDAGQFADEIWKSLDGANKISLYVRYTDLSTGEYTDRLINKNK